MLSRETAAQIPQVQIWPIERVIFYARNPRKNDAAVDRMCSSIHEFGFNKGRTVLTRTHYWYQHEPCWYLRKKNAPWFGKAGENSAIWDSPSPKFIMGGSDEEKFDHPRQKPVDLMGPGPGSHEARRGSVGPILGERHYTGRGRTHGACLLRPRSRSEVRRRDCPALADPGRQESQSWRAADTPSMTSPESGGKRRREGERAPATEATGAGQESRLAREKMRGWL
jgi:hypothetical protein